MILRAAVREGGRRLCHGGTIREAGGSLSKRAMAKEEQYFWEEEKRQIALLRDELRKGRLNSKMQHTDQLEEQVTRQQEKAVEHQRLGHYHREEMETHRKEWEHHLERVAYHNDKQEKLRQRMAELMEEKDDD